MASLPIKGTLTSNVPVALGMQDIGYPCTFTLDSSAAGRLIELSTNSGVKYFTVDYNAKSTSDMLLATIAAPVTHVRFSGQAGDKFTILPGA
jgi:hypothetical protein